MPHIPKIYLETTMFSFYYGQETTPEYRQYKEEARAVFDLFPDILRMSGNYR